MKRKNSIIYLVSFLFLHIFISSLSFAQKPELVVQTGHSGSVQSIIFSPDGTKLASGSRDNTIKLWDVNSGKEIKTFAGHNKFVTSVTFSPNGTKLASGSDDQTIKLWDVNSGKEIKTFAGHTNVVTSVTFSPDGKKLASASSDQTIKLWDVKSGKEIKTFAGHSSGVHSVTFSPDGSKLASGSTNGTIKLWEVNSGKWITIFAGNISGEHSVTFSPDGTKLASGSDDKTIKLWDVNSGKEIKTFAGNTSFVASVTISPDGTKLALGSWDGASKLWDINSSKEIKTFAGHSREVSSVTFSPDGTKLASGSDDRTIKLWDVNSGIGIKTFAGHTYAVTSVIFSPDGTKLASGSGDNTIILWDVNSGKEIKTFARYTSITSITFSPDGTKLASGGRDNTIKLWDVKSGREIKAFAGHTNAVNSITFSPDGTKLASGSNDRTIKLWDLNSGKEIKTFDGHTNWVYSITFSPDGTNLASGSKDNTIRLWDVNSGKEIKTFAGHTNWVSSVTFLPDGTKLASGSTDRKIKIWELSTGKELACLIPLDSTDWAVVTPDGKFDASKNGMKLMHYVQNNQVLPLESFFEQFYTPGLLELVMKGKTTEYRKPSVDFAFEIKLPPFVKIISPKQNLNYEKDKLKLDLDITDMGGGIDEVRLYNNGKLIINDKNITLTGKKFLKSYEITLLPGENLISATAFNKDRTEFSPYPEVTANLSAATSNINMYILTVGINEYRNPKYNLSYCKKDAQGFLNILEERGKSIFGKIIKYEIYDKDATKENIDEAFKKITKDARQQDVFVFFYAGHGAMSEGVKNIPEDFYLIPYDIIQVYGNDEGLASRGISANMLREYSKNIQAQKQLILLDACHSGGALKTIAQRGASDEKAILQLARSSGIALFAASLEEQTAKECADLDHGIFTYSLIQGLKGEAAINGQITISSLKSFLDQSVPDISKKCSGKEQFPTGQFYGQDFPIGMVK